MGDGDSIPTRCQEHFETLMGIRQTLALIEQKIEQKVVGDLVELKKEVWPNGGPSLASQVRELKISLSRCEAELFREADISLAGEVRLMKASFERLRAIMWKVAAGLIMVVAGGILKEIVFN